MNRRDLLKLLAGAPLAAVAARAPAEAAHRNPDNWMVTQHLDRPAQLAFEAPEHKCAVGDKVVIIDGDRVVFSGTVAQATMGDGVSRVTAFSRI